MLLTYNIFRIVVLPQGVDLSAIQRALGHSDSSMSLEYIDISTNQLSKAAEIAL